MLYREACDRENSVTCFTWQTPVYRSNNTYPACRCVQRVNAVKRIMRPYCYYFGRKARSSLLSYQISRIIFNAVVI